MYIYKYPRPALTVDAVVLCNSSERCRILLIKRKNDPFKNCWALPGGFVEMDETLESAVCRELKEETAIEGVKLRQLAAFGDINRDPRGRTVSVVFYGFTATESKAKGGDDAKEARWFDIDQLPDLAFDHKKVIDCALDKIKTDGTR